MAYSELIKNFNRIRDYMREFYVYGFKSRDEYTKKSARSYDDERRRMESLLGDYMGFRQTADGKNVFLSIDSRVSHHNPLYKAWKAKSFTDGDITLHFIIFDILHSPEIKMNLNELTEKIDEYLLNFDEPKTFDSSTVRKKLNEYIAQGIIVAEKQGKTMYYSRTDTKDFDNTDILDFFSEVSPCGVVGSYLLDKQKCHDEHFAFKHHYITSAIDSEIFCSLLLAMSEKKSVMIENISRHKNRIILNEAVPLRVMLSVQNGRQYLMTYLPYFDRFASFRIDNILSVEVSDVCENFDELRNKLAKMEPFMWGVSTQNISGEPLEHIEFTVKYSADEYYIHQRLEREKRCGKVEKIDENTSKFSADVLDSAELIPWIRTFICRITSISFSNKALELRFKKDIDEMYALYGIEGGEEDDI